MLLLLVAVIIFALYLYTTRNHSYWLKRNIKHDPAIPLIGTHFKNFFGKKNIVDVSQELYNKYSDEKVVGYFRGNTPELIIRDPEIVRQILSVDSASFYLRGVLRGDEKHPFMLNLFHTEGDRWKLLRQRLTPAFTTNKLKAMFPLIIKCAEKLQSVTEDLAKLDEYDVRELMARFTTELIGSCAFGIEMDSINNERSQFRALGKRMFTTDLRILAYVKLYELFPEQMRNFNVFYPVEDAVQMLREIFRSIVKMRHGKPINRHDFMDIILEMDAKGKLVGESIEKFNEDGTPVKVELQLNEDIFIGQLFIFFAAGFETSSSATSFLLHELAHNPDIQMKIQNEIDEVLSRHDNKLCYDAIAEMTQLDMAFKESLRMFPSLGCLHRVCARKYTVKDLDITIDPGVKIIIPIQAIQNDEKYFDNPSEFRPDRFEPEAEKNRQHYLYMPFGEGPRACIGTRLGVMQSLAGVATLLHKFTFEPSKSTKRRLEVNPWLNVVQSLNGGVPLKIKKRHNL